MREILFRGKRIDNQQWIQSGSFVRSGDDGINWDYYLGTGKPATHKIDSYGNICASVTLDECLFCMVDPETVGQFTGLTDKNGKKIFEGDIIRTDNGWISAVSVVKYGNFRPKMIYDMFWNYTGYFPKENLHGVYCESNKEVMMLFDSPTCIEVIGNIHDNPELLEG